MTKNSQFNEIDITPGVMPSTDATASDIPCWTKALHIRFDPTTGRVRKIGGWTSSAFNYNETILGTVRTIFSASINQKVYTILGTNSNLYSLIGSELDNITPLQTATIVASNSLATHYGTLTSNPIGTTLGSSTIVVTDADATRYQLGDDYTLSGATATNGILDTALNATHVIRNLTATTVTFFVAGTATSTGSGGGASVVRTDGLIRLTSAAHGQINSDRVKITGATTTGGIANTLINMEFILRNVTTNTFDFMTTGIATSAVTGGGGTGTHYQVQLVPGNLNQGVGQGYGAGLYGVSLYGTALVSSSGETFPQIWFCDRYGDNIIATPGNSSGVYTWDGNTAIAPVLISGAPDDVNYAFVSSNILVTFGHSSENQIFASDQGNITNWTASSSNQVFQVNVEGAGKLISHCPVDGGNLIFTETQTYQFDYIGLPLIWNISTLDSAIGIIAPMARVSVNGIAYWMGQNNFYLYRGGKAEVIPSNIGLESSCLRYVFDDLNFGQRFKIFAWYNEQFDEIWFHYPSSQSNECDRITRLNRKLVCWAPDMMDRTAAEYPTQNLSNPRTAYASSLYLQESGADADGTPLEWSATTKRYVSGADTAVQTQFVPDFNTNDTVNLEVRTYNYPQSSVAMNDNNYSIDPTTEKVPMQLNGRYYDYTFSGDALGQTFLMGQCFEEPQPGPRAP